VDEHIGVKGAYKSNPSVFENKQIDEGIFATGWEGNIVLTANVNGTFTIWTERDGTSVGLSFN
jgi:hypothetical protein